MKVHHLNCATICTLGGRLVTGQGISLGMASLVCHCLLIETEKGLVLVDSGFGLDDISRPAERLGFFMGSGLVMYPKFDIEETAARQVERLGFKRADVRHIVLTHLDLDHAGGIGDFPEAQVHVFAAELEAAKARATSNERMRYRPAQLAHARFAPHAALAGERWFGFECVREMPGLPPEILMIPVQGHTRGHCAVAVDTGAQGWLLHAGDAYFYRGETQDGSCPAGLNLFQRFMAVDGAARISNQRRLRELAQNQSGRVRVFCAHDSVELEDCLKP
jgi:glyoxylase-like metal-dependent hydrolase (beta-lactamase superfamily II)